MAGRHGMVVEVIESQTNICRYENYATFPVNFFTPFFTDVHANMVGGHNLCLFYWYL